MTRIKNYATPLAALILIEAVLIAIFIADNPTFLREEWLFLERTRELGAWSAADQVTIEFRPAVRLVYAFVYGIGIAHRSMLLFPALLTFVMAALFYVYCSKFLSRAVAFGAAAFWLLMPTHLTNDHWLAAANIDLAAILVLSALILLRQAQRPVAGSVVAGIVMGLGIAFYEGVALLALSAPLFTGLLWHRSTWMRRSIATWAGLVPFVVFALVASVGPRQKVFASPLPSFFYNFGLFAPHALPAIALTLACMVVALIVLVRVVQRRTANQGQSLVLMGIAVWLVGYIPFSLSNYDSMFFGIGDRGNIVSSFGAALFFVGVFLLLKADVSKLAYGSAAVLTVAVTAVHVDRSVEWARATRSVQELGDCLVDKGEPVRLQRGSGFLSPGAVSIDATTELRLYLQHKDGERLASLEIVPLGSDNPGLPVADMLRNPKQTLRDLGCS